MNYVIGTIAVLFILYLLGNSEEEKEERPVVKPSVQKPIPEKPREKGREFKVLAEEYADNPLRFKQLWMNRTLTVRGTIRGFGEDPVREDSHGDIFKVKGKYVLFADYSVAKCKMYFTFPADSTVLYEFKVGDEVEIEGTLFGSDGNGLVFVNCTLYDINGNRK